MEFWIFALNNPEICHFYAAQADNTSLYYVLCIEECLEDFTFEKRKVMHLRDKCLLLIDHYLVPIFCQLPLKGYLIALTEAFCESDIHKALLKLVFFYNAPEGIRDLGALNEAQEKCLNNIYKEYHSTGDDLQIPIIRSLLVNLFLLSTETNYNAPLKAGHLLTHALQFTDLVNECAFQERKKSFYAHKIGVTETTLIKALQVIFNRTFKEILIYKTLIEAMKMLVFTDKSITQIAHELNYDTSNFNKLVLKWKGMSPKDLRVNYRKLAEHVEYNY